MTDQSITAFPLLWPIGWPRCQTPKPSPFFTDLVAARNGVYRELRLLKAQDVVISSNAVLTLDGRIAARQPRIPDTGVAVYFTLDGEQRCIPCDKWWSIEDNLRAVEKTINALRGIERWGASEMVSAAFQGFQALPASTDGASWWRVLEVAPDASEVEIEQAYRRLVKVHHPDRGGDDERFHQLQTAYGQAKGGGRRENL